MNNNSIKSQRNKVVEIQKLYLLSFQRTTTLNSLSDCYMCTHVKSDCRWIDRPKGFMSVSVYPPEVNRRFTRPETSIILQPPTFIIIIIVIIVSNKSNTHNQWTFSRITVPFYESQLCLLSFIYPSNRYLDAKQSRCYQAFQILQIYGKTLYSTTRLTHRLST